MQVYVTGGRCEEKIKNAHIFAFICLSINIQTGVWAGVCVCGGGSKCGCVQQNRQDESLSACGNHCLTLYVMLCFFQQPNLIYKPANDIQLYNSSSVLTKSL